MTKLQFSEELGRELHGLSKEDIQNSLDYYAELIDDRMESGMTEAEAIAALGAPKEIARQILLDMPLPKIIKTKCKKRSAWRVWEIVLLVLGSPIWLPLLLSAASVFLSVYIVLWAFLITPWAVTVAVGGSALGCILSGIVAALEGNVFSLLLYIGAACVLLGIAILGFFACLKLTAFFIKVSAKFLRWVKSLFVKKEK